MTKKKNPDLIMSCEDTLKKIDIKRLLSKYGNFVEVEGTLIGPCPYHNDNKNSLVVKPVSGDFHCINSKCNVEGFIIELIAKFEKIRIEDACKLIQKISNGEKQFVQFSLFNGFNNGEEQKLPEYSQTQLRIYRQCPLRFWYQYIKKENLDKQTIESTIGTYIHSTLKKYFSIPKLERKQKDLDEIFLLYWKSKKIKQTDDDYYYEKAIEALRNAHNLNTDIEPLRMEMEITCKSVYSYKNELYKLSSKVDRIDWYSDNEYCLIDYKWDEEPFTEVEAVNDFQTVIYYLTWTGNRRGIAPKKISYQFLTYGIQVDIFPENSINESSVEILSNNIHQIEALIIQGYEPEPTSNFYCYNCRLFRICTATKQNE